jgi:hypothetical protein
MTLSEAIAAAEALMPARVNEVSALDPRWQAIIEVAEFIPSDPEEVWLFAARWGCSEDADLRTAIATCLVEHLLEHHFELLFPRVAELARSDAKFADTLSLCSEFGQSATQSNSAKLRRLKGELRG